MAQIIARVSGAKDGLFEEVLNYSSTIREVAKGHILAYLQEKGVSFPVNRRNGKQDAENIVLPMIDDVVAFKASDDTIHMGVITEVLKQNMILVKMIKNGKVTENKFHISLLKLIYRPNDPESFLHMVAVSLKI